MSYFKAEMHQISAGAPLGSFSAPPVPLAGFKGAYF